MRVIAEAVKTDNMTWIYRSVIGALFAISIALIRFEADAITTVQVQIRSEIQSIKTDAAVNQVTIMTLQNQIGEQAGRSQAQADRTAGTIEVMNTLRDRLTILETQYQEHVKRGGR